ncbi:MAG: transposase [Verrucomicrobiales bacterium]|nr:transposase [Verrucomicrobiales bacterium]
MPQNRESRVHGKEKQIQRREDHRSDGESTVKAVCAKHNISDATFYNWKRKYGGMDVEEARRLRALEDENGRLKRLVADLTVQNQILKEVKLKKW